MGDVHSLLRARGINPMVIERTDPQPGDRYMVGHRVVQLPGTKLVEPSYHEDPHLAVQKALPKRVWLLMGLALGLLAVGVW